MRHRNVRSSDGDRARPGALARASWLGVLLGLGGCATVGPDFQRPEVKVGDAWHTQGSMVASQAQVDTLWWKEFHDETLDRLVELAHRQNLSLQIAGLRIVEARARLGIATGNQWPEVQARGSATAIGLSENSPNATGFDHHYLDYQLGFDAIWELDFWGKYRRGTEAEAANLLATVADYHSATVSLTAEVARTYVVIRTFEVLIAQAEENVRLQEDGLQIAQSRFRNGATSELDVVQARALLEGTRASIPQLRISLQQARNALSTLLGQPAGTVEEMLVGAQEIPKAPEKVEMSVPAEMLRRRPDIRSAELLAAAQCARIGVAKADLYPSFSIFGTVGLHASTADGAGKNLFTGDALAFVVGPRITMPIFNHGKIKNNVRAQDARFQQLLISYRDTVLRAAQEVEDATAGYLNSREAAAAQQRAVEAARRSVQLSMVQYREGAADFARVLDAQRSLLIQENSFAQASSSVATNVIALFKALGGGWEWRQGQPIVPEETIREMKARTDWGDLLSVPPKQEAQSNPPPRTSPPTSQADPSPVVRADPPPAFQATTQPVNR